MRGTDDSTGHAALYEIDVLPCNVRAVEVFKHCQLVYVSNGMGAICIGFSATEVLAAMEAMAIPPKRRKRLLGDVMFMGNAAAHWINDKNRKAS